MKMNHRNSGPFAPFFKGSARVLQCHYSYGPSAAQEPEDDSKETLAGQGLAVRFSTLGLLAPVHALLLTLQLGGCGWGLRNFDMFWFPKMGETPFEKILRVRHGWTVFYWRASFGHPSLYGSRMSF